MTSSSPLSRDRLTDGDVQDRKPEGWWGDDGMISRVFAFEAYRAGVEFAVRVAELAEAQDHHPEITILYKKVRVSYYTHEISGLASGVTEYDLHGAQAVNSLYALPAETGSV